jgi:NitT/TauT family transport system substrate-binding protein
MSVRVRIHCAVNQVQYIKKLMKKILRRSLLALALVGILGGQVSAEPLPLVDLPVLLTEADNLQDLAFFVALGAGYFEDEGFRILRKNSPTPGDAAKLFTAGAAPVAVLPPPIYLSLIGERAPLKVVGSLLRNDAINLIVRRSVAEERKLTATQPLAERLQKLRGIKLGVAPGPITRLKKLFSSSGLVADRDAQLVVVMGQEQNAAFEAGRVDALYAHSPYLEKALERQDAVLIINQSAGEVRALTSPLIHALVVTAEFARVQPDAVMRLDRAIDRAEALVRTDPARATTALLKALPAVERSLAERIVAIYQPAMPLTPEVSVDAVRRALTLFPANKVAPDLSKIDLAQYVAPAFAERAVRSRRVNPK